VRTNPVGSLHCLTDEGNNKPTRLAHRGGLERHAGLEVEVSIPQERQDAVVLFSVLTVNNRLAPLIMQMLVRRLRTNPLELAIRPVRQ